MSRRGPAVALAPTVLVLLLVLTGCPRARAAPTADLPKGAGRGMAATVVKAVDGDTVDVDIAGHGRERLRLLGIDTPETVDPDEPVGCFGPEASARTHGLLPAGTAVLLQRDEEARDRYGRLLVYLWRRSDGTFVNRLLVDEGLARTLSIAPNTAHRVEFSTVEAGARAAGRGLWSACPTDSVGP